MSTIPQTRQRLIRSTSAKLASLQAIRKILYNGEKPREAERNMLVADLDQVIDDLKAAL